MLVVAQMTCTGGSSACLITTVGGSVDARRELTRNAAHSAAPIPSKHKAAAAHFIARLR
jgi:hypothetical protein